MNIDEDKLLKVFLKLDQLLIETPKGNMARYVSDNKPEFTWEVSKLYELIPWGVVKICDKEIDVDGKNIFSIDIDGGKVEKYLSTHKTQVGNFSQTQPFYFDGMTFKLLMDDGNYQDINFYPHKSESANTYLLMKAFVDELSEKGKKTGKWIEVVAKREILIKRIVEMRGDYRGKNWEDWFRSTKGNLITKIPVVMRERIEFGEYSKTTGGYFFRIKAPDIG